MSFSLSDGTTLLALETSTRSASVTLLSASFDRTVQLDDGRRHARDLLPTIDQLTKAAGTRPTRLAVGIGPGSYTGLRVGLATILGLARALPAEVTAVPSFDALVFQNALASQRCLVATNAFGGRAYIATYERTETDVKTLEAPSVIPLTDVEDFVRQHHVDVHRFDATVHASLSTPPVEASAICPSSRAISSLALVRGHTTTLTRLEPLYLQPFKTTARR